VITSKYGKTYDTADGSEQQSGIEERKAPTDREAAKARWEDDGGPSTMPCSMVLAEKPPWSVQSLQALNEAIRRSNDPDDAARAQQESERRERESVRVAVLQRDVAARARRAERDRYRNPWENT
jgi:hypothetical protein